MNKRLLRTQEPSIEAARYPGGVTRGGNEWSGRIISRIKQLISRTARRIVGLARIGTMDHATGSMACLSRWRKIPIYKRRRRSPSPISKAGVIEYRFEDGLQPIEQRLLAHPIIDRGYAQHPKLARLSRLRDPVLSDPQRLIGVLF